MGIDRIGTTLIIDLNRDGEAELIKGNYEGAQDLAIVNFFNSKGGKGKGFIEEFARYVGVERGEDQPLKGKEILDFFASSGEDNASPSPSPSPEPSPSPTPEPVPTPTPSDDNQFNLGDGQVTINGSGSSDVVVLGEGITPSSVRLERIGISGTANVELQIDIGSSNDQILVPLHFSSENNRIEQLQFADGTIWDLAGGLTFTGEPSNDELLGTTQDDVLIGAGGDDVLRGLQGNDQYRFNLGDGKDTIDEFDGSDTIHCFRRGHYTKRCSSGSQWDRQCQLTD